MKYYLLITAREWQTLQEPIDNNAFFPRSSLPLRAIIDYEKLKPVRYHYSRQMDEIINYCVKYQDECHNLYPTLEKLGLDRLH